MVLGAAIGNSATDNAIFARLDTPPEIRMAMVGEGDDKAVEFAYRYAGKPTALTNATEGVALPLLQEASSAEASATIRIKLKDLDNDEFGKFEVVDGPRADVTLAIHPDALKNPALVDPGVWIPHPASEGREGLRV